MNPHPHDEDGVSGTVYLLHFARPYRHARHYIGWTAAEDVQTRLQTHLSGQGSPLVRAVVAAGIEVTLACTFPGSRALERRLKNWKKTGQFCPTCRAARGGRAR